MPLAAVIIILSGVFIFLHLPTADQYSQGADEDNYYRQGKLIADSGLNTGFETIASDYISKTELHDTPNPLRIGSTLATSAFVKVHDSKRAISAFCSLCYLLLLAGSFLFVNSYFGTLWGLIALLLLAVSPLELAMARRALMDMPAMAFSSLSCFMLWHFARNRKRFYAFLFIVIFIAAISLKETSVLLVPFFALVLLYLKLKKETAMSYLTAACLVIIPPLVVAGLYLLTYGRENMMAILHAMAEPSDYSAYWGQGPWYRTLIDFMMLSPFVLALGLAFIGHSLLNEETGLDSWYIIALAAYIIVCYSLLPKNVRYCILFDLPLRIMAAGFIVTVVSLPKSKKAKLSVAAVFIFLIAFDIHSFYMYFIEGEMYDTISFNLLEANRIIPPLYDGDNVQDAGDLMKNHELSLSKSRETLLKNPSAANYETLAQVYLMQKFYTESILANMAVLHLQPQNIAAHCNIALAYDSLNDWKNAIRESEAILQFDTGSKWARKNLEYCKAQMENEQAGQSAP